MSSGSRRTDVRGSFTLPVSPAEAFPMFDAVREAEWAHDWRVVAIHPSPFRLETDATFEVPAPNGVTEVWTVVDCDPAACRVEYLAVAANDLTRRVTVECASDPAGTRVTVRYIVTAWSPAGLERIGAYNDAYIAAWREPVLAALIRNGAATATPAPA